jgi:bloom syndrome protein
MFKRRKKKKTRMPSRTQKAQQSSSESSDTIESSSSSSNASESEVEDDGKEWAKKVEEPLRKWIEAVECRRDVADEHFDNPPRVTCTFSTFNLNCVI